jgi:CRP-like cAMP-binding protein
LFSSARPVSLPHKQVLYEAGAPIDHLYFIEQGIASALTSMANGTTIEVGMIGLEGVAGLPALLGGDTSTQQIIIQVPGNALQIGAAAGKLAVEESASFRRLVFRYTRAFLNTSAQTAACNRLHSVEQRCARWLLMSHDRVQEDVIPLTHDFFASMLGVRRAGVTETVGELQRSGLIRNHRGQVTIIDRDGLESVACECYRADRDRFMRLL